MYFGYWPNIFSFFDPNNAVVGINKAHIHEDTLFSQSYIIRNNAFHNKVEIKAKPRFQDKHIRLDLVLIEVSYLII